MVKQPNLSKLLDKANSRVRQVVSSPYPSTRGTALHVATYRTFELARAFWL